MLLQASPQDILYSRALMVRMIFFYFLSGVLVMSGLMEASVAPVRMLFSISILLVFSYALLTALNKLARLVQTVTALAGSGILFNILAWPVLGYMSVPDVPDTTMQMLSLFMLMVLSWEIMVTAHIYRHALNIQVLSAILLSLGLFFISLSLTQMIFPEMTQG